MSQPGESVEPRTASADRSWALATSPWRSRQALRDSSAGRPFGRSVWAWLVVWQCVFGVFLSGIRPDARAEPPAAKAPATTQDSSTALGQAQRLLTHGRYEEALEAFEPLRDKHPVEVGLGEARCQRARGNFKAARNALRLASQSRTESAQLSAELARLAFEQGRYEEADRHVAEALRKDKQSEAARWWQAELDRVRGRIEQAEAGYLSLVEHYNGQRITDAERLRWIGLAAARHARLTGNNNQLQVLVADFYPTCLRHDPQFWEAHLDAARLFLEKYNRAEALTQLNAALAINPNAGEAHAARAELAMQDLDLASADAALRRALAINPNLIDARRIRADWLVISMRRDDALVELQAARRTNPADEPTLGRLAALWILRDGTPVDPDTDAGKLIGEAEARNPRCGDFYAALADTLDLARRYPQAAHYYEVARRRDSHPGDVAGRLGLTYMRLGQEAKAAELLRESFQADQYHVRVKNSLEVLDLLRDYAVLETEHFILRFDRGRDDLLAQHAARYLEQQVYPDLVGRLGFEPPDKSLIEIFSRARNTSGHGWFSARMVGLPRIGTVAACAGKVVALASPNDMPTPYGWARVLRHEFVHLVNLQQTNFNVPHWFTEGLAVLHEDRPRSSAWNRLLVRRLRAEQLFTLEDLDVGFLRPSNRDDWTLAYCQAELYAEFMVRAFGDDALSRMLAAYANNADTPMALRQCFGLDLMEFERRYRTYLEQQVAELRVPVEPPSRSRAELEALVEREPENDAALSELAALLLRQGDTVETRRLAEAVRQRSATHPLASLVLARLAIAGGDAEAARSLLRESLDLEHPLRDTLELLAGLALRDKQYDEAARLYRVGLRQFRHEEDLWLKSLARVYLLASDASALRDVLERLADLDDESVSIRKKLAQLELERQDFTAAAKWANRALEIDVQDAAGHVLLAQAWAGQQRHEAAAAEYELAVRLDGRRPAWRLALAQAWADAGQKTRARQVVEQLLESNPNDTSAQELLEKLCP